MKLFDYADRYLQRADWKDLALIKFCLFAMGLLVGVALPRRARKPAALVAMLVFIGTYVPLMVKFFSVMQGYSQDIDI